MSQLSPVDLQAPLTVLKGVGRQLAERLHKLSLTSLQDLLFHLPHRYVDRTRITAIGQLRPYQHAVIQAEVQDVRVLFGRRRSLLCRVRDHSGSIGLRFFHFSAAQKQSLGNAFQVRCFGEVRPGANGLELYHPEYQVFGEDNEPPLEQSLTPVYYSSEGLTQSRIRSLVSQLFERLEQQGCQQDLQDLLQLDSGKQALSLLQRLQNLHFPPAGTPVDLLTAGDHPWQQSLVIEELTAWQLSLLRQKNVRLGQRAVALTDQKLSEDFIHTLPFELTPAQQTVCIEISRDLRQELPMMRLLQGDVGSGKTVVAAVAALIAIGSGKQVGLMVPTDILMEQHRQNFEQWFAPLGIDVAWLSGSQTKKQRDKHLQRVHDGSARMVLGTHALFQESVVFDDLGLVIVDEQHRFGVHQRLHLRNKGASEDGCKGGKGEQLPHQLVMTATPIPRTLAMSAYSDMDVSIIDALPAGRVPAQTVVISQKRREEVVQRVHHACAEGKQVYWVCTLIEQSETLSAEAAEDTEARLREEMPDLGIALIHGRLKPQEKDRIMTRFSSGEVQLLVATTVIEVGVNVPNASLMVIENPERLGLAQLHQLRGRVGRGSVASFCVLLYGDKLSQQGKSRLQAMRETNDGFRIAEIDLELRGPGEILGTRQTGDIDFKLADLQRDLPLLEKVRSRAEALLAESPDRVDALIERWVGDNERFAQA